MRKAVTCLASRLEAVDALADMSAHCGRERKQVQPHQHDSPAAL